MADGAAVKGSAADGPRLAVSMMTAISTSETRANPSLSHGLPADLPQQPVKSNREMPLVAAGHAAKGGSAIRTDEDDGQGKHSILKVLDEIELATYLRLQDKYIEDPAKEFIPEFMGVVENVEDAKGDRFIRISNLLQDFTDPKVMDVKIGVRTFLEEEAQVSKLRPDLYEKMTKMYPSEVLPEERQKKGVTKFRWMSVRDACSTIRPLGYRIDGVAGYRRKSRKEIDEDIASYRNRSDTCWAFSTFCEVAATDDGEIQDVIRNSKKAVAIAESLRYQFQRMRTAVDSSEFIRQHEFIGTSFLLVADSSGNAGVYWIDFAKTTLLSNGLTITHEKQWEPGNHEDGIVFGLDNLIDTFDQVVTGLRKCLNGGIDSEVVESSFWLGEPPKRLRRGRRPIHWMRKRIAAFFRRKQSKALLRQRTRDGNQPRFSENGTFSDVAILSMVPALAGYIADTGGAVWDQGKAVRKSLISGVETAGVKVGAAATAAGAIWKGGCDQGAKSSAPSATSRATEESVNAEDLYLDVGVQSSHFSSQVSDDSPKAPLQETDGGHEEKGDDSGSLCIVSI